MDCYCPKEHIYQVGSLSLKESFQIGHSDSVYRPFKSCNRLGKYFSLEEI